MELLVVKATRQWAAEKKQALEFAARKACEIKGVAYVEPEAPAAPARKRGVVKETRTTVYGDGGPVQVVMVTGGENRYERMDVAFHERLRQGFLEIARAEPARCVVIDATRPVEAVTEAIAAAVGSRLSVSL